MSPYLTTAPEKLRAFADRINQMWGKNPDADMLRESADLIEKLIVQLDEVEAELEVKTATTTKTRSKKEV